MTPSLETERSAAADQEFENYECDGLIEDSSGWEYWSVSNEWCRPIFVKDLENLNGDSLLGHFTVEFKPNSPEVISAQASLGGNDFGQRGSQEPQSPGMR